MPQKWIFVSSFDTGTTIPFCVAARSVSVPSTTAFANWIPQTTDMPDSQLPSRAFHRCRSPAGRGREPTVPLPALPAYEREPASHPRLSPVVNHSPVPDRPQGESTPKPGGSETARGRLYSTKKVEMPVLAVNQNARVCIREVWLPERNSYQTTWSCRTRSELSCASQCARGVASLRSTKNTQVDMTRNVEHTSRGHPFLARIEFSGGTPPSAPDGVYGRDRHRKPSLLLLVRMVGQHTAPQK